MNEPLTKMLQKSEYITASKATVFLTESYIAERDFVLAQRHVAILIKSVLKWKHVQERHDEKGSVI